MLTNPQGWRHNVQAGHENVVQEKASKQRLSQNFLLFCAVQCSGMHITVGLCYMSPPTQKIVFSAGLDF